MLEDGCFCSGNVRELFHDEPYGAKAPSMETGQNTITLKNTTAGACEVSDGLEVDSPEQTEENTADAAALCGDKFSFSALIGRKKMVLPVWK